VLKIKKIQFTSNNLIILNNPLENIILPSIFISLAVTLEGKKKRVLYYSNLQYNQP
jgi:hypothetical protein